jgi:hypothetical protein
MKPLSLNQLKTIRELTKFIVTRYGQVIPFDWHINQFVYKQRPILVYKLVTKTKDNEKVL